MKIAFVSTVYGYLWGGSEELWYQISQEALKDDTEVMASRFRYPDQEHEKIQKLQSNGAHIHYRENREQRFRIKNKRYYIRALGLLTGNPKHKTEIISVFNELYEFKPNLIVLSLGFTYDYYYERAIYDLLERMKGTPFVLISQYHDEYTRMDHDRGKLLDVLKAAHLVYFVSRRNKEVVERQLAIQLDNARIINNPVNMEIKTVIPWRVSDGKIHFACVARLDTHTKGQDILLQILGSEKWKARSWVLHLYGTGNDRSQLESLIGLYGLEGRIFFHGHFHDIREIWMYNDLMLLPSHGEGTPLSLMEAMICGRPAVATDVGGIEDCIIDGQTGFLADWGSVRSFGRAMEEAWQKRADWEMMGQKAHDHILNHFDLEIASTMYKEFKKLAL